MRCSVCKHVFKVVSAAAAAAPAWQIRTTDNTSFSANDVATLREWISEGRLTPDDEVSRTGRNWVRLGEMPEFGDLFRGQTGAVGPVGVIKPVFPAPPGSKPVGAQVVGPVIQAQPIPTSQPSRPAVPPSTTPSEHAVSRQVPPPDRASVRRRWCRQARRRRVSGRRCRLRAALPRRSKAPIHRGLGGRRSRGARRRRGRRGQPPGYQGAGATSFRSHESAACCSPGCCSLAPSLGCGRMQRAREQPRAPPHKLRPRPRPRETSKIATSVASPPVGSRPTIASRPRELAAEGSASSCSFVVLVGRRRRCGVRRSLDPRARVGRRFG